MLGEIRIRVLSSSVCRGFRLVRCTCFKDFKQNSLDEDVRAEEEHTNRRQKTLTVLSFYIRFDKTMTRATTVGHVWHAAFTALLIFFIYFAQPGSLYCEERVCMHVCVHVCVCVCVCVYMCIYIHTHAHIYIYTTNKVRNFK
jgi:heme/copper-type cytochrome/quinol oxidase subunit 4